MVNFSICVGFIVGFAIFVTVQHPHLTSPIRDCVVIGVFVKKIQKQ